MADPLSWSLGADGFPDLNSDFTTTNQFDNGTLDDIDGKNYFVRFIQRLKKLILSQK